MTVSTPVREVTTRAGFTKAVQSVLPALRGYARRLTHETSSSDDLVQDTLTRAWAARRRFEPGTNFKAWLFRILRNHFLTGTRRAWRNAGWDPVTDEHKLVAAPDQETGLLLDDLERALAALPEPQRVALLLVTRHELSYEEAAESLGVPRGTVSSQVSRARAAVLCFLENESAARPHIPSDDLPASAPRPLYAAWKNSGSRLIG